LKSRQDKARQLLSLGPKNHFPAAVRTDYVSGIGLNAQRRAAISTLKPANRLNEEDKAILQDATLPIDIFNREGTTVESVARSATDDMER
jgi:hypothetical protein